MNKTIKISGFLLLGFFVLNLIATPFWRIAHDTVFHSLHRSTYRCVSDTFHKEIYDTSMPGTFIFHIALGNLFGYTESGLQLFNFFFIIAFFCGANFYYLKNIDFFPRLIGSIYFLLVYQSYGLEMSLQRDFIACFFIICSVLFL